MGGATVEGLVKTGLYKNEDITVSDPSEAVLDKFVKKGVSVTTDNKAATADADVVMVCVKPWLVERVLSGIKDELKPAKQVLVVIAAGVKPKVQPIRGGTDGAQLSFMGLPCPNLFTGAVNFHGPHEFVSIQVMQKAVQTIINLCTTYHH